MLCFRRFIYFWASPPKPTQPAWLEPVKQSLFLASSILALWGLVLALKQSRPGVWLLFWLVLLYPAVYYAVYAIPRYRHPIEPELVILCVFLIVEALQPKVSKQGPALR